MHLTRSFTLSCSCLVLVVLIALSGPAFATSSSVTVGLCAGPGTHYTTIQAAVTAVSAGGTSKSAPALTPSRSPSPRT